MGRRDDQRVSAFIEFFNNQGIKFIDVDTGEELTADGFKRERRRHENKSEDEHK